MKTNLWTFYSIKKDCGPENDPAMDILNSVTRCVIDVVLPDHMKVAQKLKSTFAVYNEAEDMINVGACVEGKNKKTDYAIKMIGKTTEFLRQDVDEWCNFNDDISRLIDMVSTSNVANRQEKAAAVN